MQQSLMTLRVRPPRIVVLIDRGAKVSEFREILRFFSQIWGGRYCMMIPVDAQVPDELTKFRLRETRPELVYGVGIDDTAWSDMVHAACQPRKFASLAPEIAHDVRRADREAIIHGDRAVIAMINARNERSRFKRELCVVSAEGSLQPYCAAMFGVHHSDLATEYRDEAKEFKSSAAQDFVDLCIDFANTRKQTWLDATAFGLSIWRADYGEIEPTIVLVRDLITDLSLFWNKRIASDYDDASWIIPVPADQSMNENVLQALVRWLGRFDKVSNYCTVASASVTKAESAHFMQELKDLLKSTSISYVDFEPLRNRLPIVVPYDSEVIWPVAIEGRNVQLVPPSPKSFEFGSSSECWFVDLLSDPATKRAPLEMVLPPSRIVPEILNGPCPPSFAHSVIRQFGDGVDSINLRCSSRRDVVRFYVPAPDEVLEESLLEGGYKAIHDEKRSSYLPAIERFGGIYQAAAAFSGKSAEILKALQGGPLLPNRIRRLCRLGDGELPIDDYLGRIENTLQRETERTKRIARRRFKQYSQGDIPESLSLSALLEHWADRTIITRTWELGPCSYCHQKWFVDRLDVQKPVVCSNCGTRMLLPERVRIGYSLAPTVKHAFEQGLIPVVLTGRFLRNLTHHGFFWLPGMKFRAGDDYGDADIVACCDGRIVFAECKRLTDVPAEASVWREVVEQLFALSRVAIKCEATLVVFASHVDSYPGDVLQEIETELASKIPYLILNNQDLEVGHRKTTDGRWMSIADFMPVEFPEVRIEREAGARQINFGPMLYTKGG